MRANVGLQYPEMRLLEGRTPLRRLPVPRVRQHPVSALRDTGPEIRQGGGGYLKSSAAWRAAPLLPEASQKTLHRAKAETIEENEAATGDGKGGAGDMPGYLPTGEDQRIQEVYRVWMNSNDGAHLNRGMQDNKEWQTW